MCVFIFYYDMFQNNLNDSKMTRLHLAVLFLFVASINCTTVTFYIDHQVQQPLDYVQISAVVKVKQKKLQLAISQATKIITNVDATVDGYCHTYAKNKSECEGNVETSAYSIHPKYEIVKRKPVFSEFVVTHQMTIKVKQSPEFGQLVDEILKNGVTKINQIQWKPIEEVKTEENAVEEGSKQAHQICEKIGMKLDKIVSVSQVTDFGEEEDDDELDQNEGNQSQEQENQQEEEEEEPLDISDDIVYYKFVVECHPGKK